MGSLGTEKALVRSLYVSKAHSDLLSLTEQGKHCLGQAGQRSWGWGRACWGRGSSDGATALINLGRYEETRGTIQSYRKGAPLSLWVQPKLSTHWNVNHCSQSVVVAEPVVSALPRSSTEILSPRPLRRPTELESAY